MKKRAFLLLIPFCLFGQNITPNTITIDVSTTVTIPADMISFTINLMSESDSVHHAFRNHLIREKNIVNIIRQFKIEASDVFYSLLDIRKNQDREGKTVYHTIQTVTISLQNIDAYYDFQFSLITNGLDQFNSRFSVKDESDLIKKGYDTALKRAAAEATLLANNLGRKIGKVIAVLSRSHADEVFEIAHAPMRMQKGTLLDINKLVSKQFNLKVVYALSQ